MNSNYACLTLTELKRERQREYWRRWKERHAMKEQTKNGWKARFARSPRGWYWKAQQKTNGAVLENGFFQTLRKAKQDFSDAVE